MTPRGVIAAVAAVAAYGAGRLLGVDELLGIALVLAAAVPLGVVYVRLATSQLSTRRLVDHPRTLVGGTIESSLQVRNDARVPSPTIMLDESLPATAVAEGHLEAGVARFVLGGVGPGRVATATCRIHARSRGRYRVGPVTVRLRDPLGLAERVRRYTATEDVLVYPRIEPLPDGTIRGAHMGSGSSDTRRVFATGDDFYTMREYVRGDDLRHVHWPSTAHRQTLMVRQMEQPWQAHATVFCDVRDAAHSAGADGSLERAISIAASIVYHLADRDYALRLLTDASHGRHTERGWEEILETLATIEASAATSMAPGLRACTGGEGLFTAVVGTPPGRTSLATHEDVRALLGVKGFTQRAALVVMRSGADPRARELAGLLTASGWRATTVEPGQPLIDAWQALARPRSRRPAATAFEGGR